MARRIDVHHHFMSQAYIDVMGVDRVASPGSAGHAEAFSAEQSLAFMDTAGIETAILSVSAPGVELGMPERTARLARDCNEAQARYVRDHPGRFGMLAVLPLPDIDASLAEIAHAFDTLKADGAVVMSNYGGEYIGSPDFVPVFEELNRRKAVLLVHPSAPLGYRGFPGVSLSTLEFPFDTARAITSVLYHGTPARYPHVKFIWSHAGGAMPAMAGRMAALSQRNARFILRGPEKVAEALRGFYYDTTQSLSRPTFAALSALAPFEHLLFGSDCPFASEGMVRMSVGELDALALSPAQQARLERGNALALFPRFV
jgi:predicted TIM-barrel fold metal-dependent hydrolase